MIAIVGLPGSQHHDFRWFPRSERKAALAWLERRFRDHVHRTGQPIETEYISDKAAARRKWRDGSYIYRETLEDS
jgi:hypothetical protein